MVCRSTWRLILESRETRGGAYVAVLALRDEHGTKTKYHAMSTRCNAKPSSSASWKP